MEIGDIVQIDPEVETFGGCFAVVDELKDNGRHIAYVEVPAGGQAYIFLKDGKYKLTGGKAVWMVE